MELGLFLCYFLAILTFLLGNSQAYRFIVGGKHGWVVNPSESYNHWAERNRFQVNDTLYFKYEKGNDSVLIVTKDNYDKCNTQNPIISFTDGDTEIKFDRSGLFFFISGNADNCNKGQKLIVLVLALRPPKSSPTPPSPPPSHEPPSPTPPASSPGPGEVAPAPAPHGDHSAAASTVGFSSLLGLGFVVVVFGKACL